MELLWTIIFYATLIKCSHLLLHPHSSQMSLSHADKLEEHKLSVSELMKFCPHKCSCYNLTVDCDFINLNHMPQNLHFSVNHLTVVGNEIINLFYNSSLGNLRVLNVSQNNLQTIDKKWISSLKELQILDLSQNALHTKAIENVFKNPSLQHLNLSGNKLNELNDRMFQELYVLSNLDLSYNEIKNISRNCFSKQKNLQILNLSSNKFYDLQYDWFKNLGSLTTLILSQNKLKILRNVVFSPLNNLQVLDISQNHIQSIGLLSFKGLMSLKYLNISCNNISNFQDGVFRYLTLLNVLDISKNPFFSIDNIFIYTSKIQFLYMNGLSRFPSLTASSLKGLRQLEYLDLSGSVLFSEVSMKAFVHAKNMKSLDLSHGKLTSLRKGVFNHFETIESINLKGNPWDCDCYMYWLLIWLSEHSLTHLLSPSETFCSKPSDLHGHILLDALDHNMVCTNASVSHFTEKTKFKVGSPAFLECQVEGDPLPTLTWITPQKLSFHWLGFKNNTNDKDLIFKMTSSSDSINQDIFTDKDNDRFFLMPNGNLGIRNVKRGDGGLYVCIASNPLNNDSVSIRLTLDYEYFVQIKIVSILVGTATSFGFLLFTLIAIFIKMILRHFGVKCPCQSSNASPRTQQVRKVLVNMEHYKKRQLERLRDNYNGQVQKIKDNCMQQMEHLRESYSSQAECLRDIKEYGTLQIDRIRENYYFQVQRVRDYSASQIIRLRENYIFQRNRIRKFSAHHLYKLRENYKLQQQHLNKILENLNIESCRNVCQRTDSVMFEPEIITLENVMMPKICLQTFAKETCDSIDNSSQISAYFTPDEAGSEVSGLEINEPENLENTTKLKMLDISDVIVRVEENTVQTISHVPEQAPSSSSHMHNQKPSNETLV